MTYEQLVAKQALKIDMLEQEIEGHAKAFFEIHRWIYGIGQPLNDNKLKYTNDQLSNFTEIANIIEPFLSNIKF